MTFPRRLRRGLTALFTRAGIDHEVDHELRLHVELLTEEFQRSGLSPSEARRAALLRFGGLTQIRERSVDTIGARLLEDIGRDTKYALRGLRRTPVFTMTAVLMLACSIGAVSTVLTLAHTYFFQLLPVDRPREVAAVSAIRGPTNEPGPISYPDYLNFRDRTRTFKGLAAHYSSAPLFVTIDDNAREINGAVVSANYFDVLELRPALGRFFRPDEDSVPDRDRVAVISHELWRDRFGAAAEAIGAGVTINGVSFTVVGVAPHGFRGITANPNEIYIPSMMLRVGYRFCRDALAANCTVLNMVGRLAEGQRLEDATAEMAALVPHSWTQARAGENRGVTVALARPVDRSDAEAWFVRLLAIVTGALLLACCANLSGWLIARGRARARELAIRVSLGASGGRLMRQLLAESLLLALLGGALGTWLSVAATTTLKRMFYSFDAEGHPLYYDFTLHPLVILAVLAISVLAAVVFGLLPAIEAVRLGAAESLKRHSSASTGHSRWGSWLVTAQSAVAVALVAVASLLWASANTAVNGAHFESSHVALLRLRPRLARYPPDKAQAFLRSVLQRFESLRTVESASLIAPGAVLLGGTANVALPGSEGAALRVGYGEVGGRYFQTLRVAVLRGREFDERDRAGTPPVAIVSDGLARRLWPNGNVLGEMVSIGNRAHAVIGVVDDISLQNRTESMTPYVYVPFWQNPAQIDARLCVRVAGDPAAMLPTLVQQVHHADPDVPVAEIITLPLQMEGIFRPVRLSAAFAGYAATLTACLSVIGLYGALAFSVSRRTKEIGIRMALGAAPGRILAGTFSQGLQVVLPGIALGLLAAFGGIRSIQHLLYKSAADDVIFYGAAIALVMCGALLACWLPARRAAGIAPLMALRDE